MPSRPPAASFGSAAPTPNVSSPIGFSPSAVPAAVFAESASKPRAAPIRASGSRAANAFILVFALSTLLIILHRNGILYDVCSGMGLGAAYSSLEQRVLGPPSELTPRGVQVLDVPSPGASSEPVKGP
jgi:hypothetical protein